MKDIIITVLLVTAVIATVYIDGKANNFEECLLKNMKNQNEDLTQVAVRLCERKFPKEKSVH